MEDCYRQAASLLVLRPAATAKAGYELLLLHKPRKRDVWQLPQGGKEEGETAEIKVETKEVKAAAAEEAPTLEDLVGIGEKGLALLKENGYDSLEKIAKASVDELTQIKGLGKIKAEKIIEQSKKMLGQ